MENDQLKLLVFGHDGQVAHELRRLRPDARFLRRAEADLSDPAACGAIIGDLSPGAVINAAGYTAVDKAEDEEVLATTINGAAPAEMARASAALGIPFVHLSTDYVFGDQTGESRGPAHPVAPQNAYGRSKLKGERAIAAEDGRYAILRTSWVFSASGSNFVRTMLRLSESRDEIKVVDDQVGGPTPAADIARACLAVAGVLADDPGKSGIYHYSGAPDVSWKQFAEAIFAAAGRRVMVRGVPTSDYPTRAVRPLNSRLDCSSTKAAFGLERPDWRRGLEDVLAELTIRGS